MGIDAAAAMTYQAGRRGTGNAWEAAASLVGRTAVPHPRPCGSAGSHPRSEVRQRSRTKSQAGERADRGRRTGSSTGGGRGGDG